LGVLIGLAAPARTEPGSERSQPAAPLVAHHPMLRASLERISSGSRLWADALRALEGSGRRVIVLAPDEVRHRDSPSSTATPFDPEQLAEVWPVVVSGSRVPVVFVVVNLPLLRQIHHSQPWSSPANIYQDLDRIVIHEVYGHAFPYLLAGDVSGRCPDAAPGQRPADACAIKRENAVRAELRLGLREDAGLSGLALMRSAAEQPFRESAWIR
jgi:hypothetical protein